MVNCDVHRGLCFSVKSIPKLWLFSGGDKAGQASQTDSDSGAMHHAATSVPMEYNGQREPENMANWTLQVDRLSFYSCLLLPPVSLSIFLLCSLLL